MIEKFFGVFALAILEMSAAIPIGLRLQLPLALLIAAAVSGALIGAAAGLFFGNGIRRLFFWRKKDQAGESRVSTWLLAKGPWAIGLLGPVLIGPVFSAGLAGAIGLPKRLSMALLAAGIVLWAVIFSLLGHAGLAAMR